MKSKKLISVIIPVYNTQEFLAKCLDSVFDQTYKNIEVIVINDGSIDDSFKILTEYKKKHKNMILHNQNNSGQAVARNYGISIAKGEYITFVDSDDYIDNEMIERLYKSIEDNKSDISICNINFAFSNGNTRFLSNYEEFSSDSIKNFMISHAGPVARLYKTEVFKKNDLKFLENCIYEDLALIPVVGKYINSISVINDPLYYYYINLNSTMHKKSYNSKILSIFKVMEHLYMELKDDYFDELEFLYINHLVYSAGLRFSKYKETRQAFKDIKKIMLEKFPDWKKNKYLHKKSKKFIIICNLVVGNHYYIVKILSKIKG